MMSKIFKIVTVLACIVVSIQAEAQVKAGLRAGVNYADLGELNPKAGIGFHAGTYLRFSLAGILELEPGIQYAQRRFGVHPDFPSSRLHLNYIDVPVVARIGLMPFVDLFAGPQASVLVSKRYKGEGQFDRLNDFPQQELGALIGIGVSIPLGINLQASYDFGLTNPVHNGHEIKNRVFKISLGKDF
ncbi:MAG TPA: porin family protein [Cyclobacteriaceae bacterium]|nr:porin family protein [Cyclobacteriaceae bacterium]